MSSESVFSKSSMEVIENEKIFKEIKEDNNQRDSNLLNEDLKSENINYCISKERNLENEFEKCFDDVKNGKWTNEEDEQLKRLVEVFGMKNWKKISEEIPNRSPIQCLHRWTKILQPGLVKGPWTIEEDYDLSKWVKDNGPKKWSSCAELIKGRSGKQCRERWFNTLNPNVIKGNWTAKEDYLIFKLFSEYGSKWSKISANFKGRTENSIKNRFYSTLRRINSENKKNDLEIFNQSNTTLEDLLKYFPQAYNEKKKAFLVEDNSKINNSIEEVRNTSTFIEKKFSKNENYEFENNSKIIIEKTNSLLNKKISREENSNSIKFMNEKNLNGVGTGQNISLSQEKFINDKNLSLKEVEDKIIFSQNLKEKSINIKDEARINPAFSLIDCKKKTDNLLDVNGNNRMMNLQLENVEQNQIHSNISSSNVLKLFTQLYQLERILMSTRNEIKKFDNLSNIFNLGNNYQYNNLNITNEKDLQNFQQTKLTNENTPSYFNY